MATSRLRSGEASGPAKDSRRNSEMNAGKKQSSASRLDVLPSLNSSSRRQSSVGQPGDSSHRSLSPLENTAEEVELGPHHIDAVITGPEVELLRITDDTLMKAHTTQHHQAPSLEETKTVTHKLLVKKRAPQQQRDSSRIGAKSVAVLKPIPHGSTAKELVNLGAPPPGPRLDETGTFVPHSLLGGVEDYTVELANAVSETTLNRTVTRLSALPPVYRSPESPEKKPRIPFHEKNSIPHESNALQHWTATLEGRKRHQELLADKIGSSPTKLTMNQGDAFRTTQEQRMLVDRTAPLLEHGKGYRVGSEFFSQGIQLGDAKSGIRTAVGRTEYGNPPELELVGVPHHILGEKGVGLSSGKNVPSHYTWRESVYLEQRKSLLKAVSKEMDSNYPDFHRLQVVGRSAIERGKETQPLPRTTSLDSLEFSSDSEMELEMEQNILELDLVMEPLASQADLSVPMLGPVLSINDHILKWEGPPKPCAMSPKEFSVPFVAQPKKIVRSSLLLSNGGTTALYFSWQKVHRPNTFQTKLSEGVQRFYFDTRGGVLFPGESLRFEFLFKSEIPGVFTERWSLCTGPVLCGGRPIHIKLTGIAHLEDLHDEERNSITSRLMHQVAVTTANKLINQIIDSICSPPRTPSPQPDTVCMEEDLFAERNPQLHYNYDLVTCLKRLYCEVFDPSLEEPIEETPAESGKSGKKDDKGKKDKPHTAQDTKKGSSKDESKGTIEEEVSPESVEIPPWNLSVESLQELILGVEDDARRETKLTKMNNFVGLLSLPNPGRLLTTSTGTVRKILNGLFDEVESSSAQIRRTLGLAALPFSQSKDLEASEAVMSPEPGAGARDGKKKSATKESKKGKAGSTDKKSLSTKEDKSKPGGKKSRQGTSPSPSSRSQPADNKQISGDSTKKPMSSPPDEVLEKKYKEQFSNAVYQLLGQAAGEIERTLSGGTCSRL